jgi:tetratricopeptide (TPR) repeat protein
MTTVTDVPAMPRSKTLLIENGLILILALFAPGFEVSLQAQPGPAEKEARPVDTAGAPTLAEARDWFMEGYYQKATEAYTALSEEPDSRFQAELGLAGIRLQTGRYQEAIDGLIAMDGRDSAEWHYVLARAYRLVGRYQETLDHARAAVEIVEDHAAARHLMASMLEELGRRGEAIEAYKWFDRQLVERTELKPDARWITHTAQGFMRYSVLTQAKDLPSRTNHVLNNMLVEAYGRLDRSYWPARIAAADLLREKYNNSQDDGSVSDYRAALRINSNLPQAHVGLGRVMLEQWAFEEVERRARLALEVNAQYAPAFHLLADNLITERRYQEAVETCEQALAINANDLEALSICAAAHACMYENQAVEKLAERVRAINPRCALFHRKMGDALAGIRQFAASEREYLKAIEFDPTDANARTELGMMYMQWGPEDKARGALDAAWNLDRFNERTKFTLELLDMLDDFARYESEHFIIKYKEETDPGLGEYVANYLEEVYFQVTDDYNWPLRTKTIIELFPAHEQFGVRITGKPWIHTVGACTGRVIALSSPRQAPELPYGAYNLGRVLKHEFAHTVTLAATNNRIPHWFTEGLAVLQEDSPRSFEWCKLLAHAIRHDELFTLESINWGFIRPRKASDRGLAYAQSEWMVEYIIERFGYETINRMLEAYASGKTQPEVVEAVLGISMEQFDKEFKTWAHGEAEDWGFDLTPPESPMKLRALALVSGDDPEVKGRLAKAEYDAENLERALNAARAALELDEQERNALEVFCLVLERYTQEEFTEAGVRQYHDEMLPALKRLAEVDPQCWTAPRLLGAIALARKEWDEAEKQLKTLQRLCPQNPFSWEGLSGIYLQRGEDEQALIQLVELARRDEHDPEVPGQIGKIFMRKGELGEAAYWLRQALHIDPFSVELHELLGEIHLRMGHTRDALREYRMLTRLEPEKAEYYERAAFAAHKLGEKETARKLAEKAVKLDAASSAKSLLP